MKSKMHPLRLVLKVLLSVSLLGLWGIGNSYGQTIHFSTAYYAGIPSKFEDSNGLWWNTPLPWANGKVTNAVDEFNQATSVSLSIDSRFDLYFNSGPVTSTLGYASEISKNGVLVGATYPTAEISLSGLNTALTYDLTFYASVGSNGISVQDRRMLINAFGENAAEQEALNVYSTATTPDEAMVTIYGIRPDQDGGIQITFSYPSSESIRGHINAISITAIPEPGSIAFLSIGAFAMIATLYRKRN